MSKFYLNVIKEEFVLNAVGTVQHRVDCEQADLSIVLRNAAGLQLGIAEGRRHPADRVDFPVITLPAAKSAPFPAGVAVSFLACSGSQQSGDRSDGCWGGNDGRDDVGEMHRAAVSVCVVFIGRCTTFCPVQANTRPCRHHSRTPAGRTASANVRENVWNSSEKRKKSRFWTLNNVNNQNNKSESNLRRGRVARMYGNTFFWGGRRRSTKQYSSESSVTYLAYS